MWQPLTVTCDAKVLHMKEARLNWKRWASLRPCCLEDLLSWLVPPGHWWRFAQVARHLRRDLYVAVCSFLGVCVGRVCGMVSNNSLLCTRTTTPSIGNYTYKSNIAMAEISELAVDTNYWFSIFLFLVLHWFSKQRCICAQTRKGVTAARNDSDCNFVLHGASPFLFSPALCTQFYPSSPHPSPVLASLPVPSPPSHACLRFLRHFTLFFFTFVKSHNVPCPFLTDIACHYVSLCRFLIFLPPPSFLFSSATGQSTWDPGVFTIDSSQRCIWLGQLESSQVWQHPYTVTICTSITTAVYMCSNPKRCNGRAERLGL